MTIQGQGTTKGNRDWVESLKTYLITERKMLYLSEPNVPLKVNGTWSFSLLYKNG